MVGVTEISIVMVNSRKTKAESTSIRVFMILPPLRLGIVITNVISPHLYMYYYTTFVQINQLLHRILHDLRPALRFSVGMSVRRFGRNAHYWARCVQETKDDKKADQI